MEQMLKLCVFLMRAKLTLVEAVEHTVAVDKLAVRGLFTYALNVLSKINRNGGLEGLGGGGGGRWVNKNKTECSS